MTVKRNASRPVKGKILRPQPVIVESVTQSDDAHLLADVLSRVWGQSNTVSVDVIVAIIHSGGYASLARVKDHGKIQIVGGSLGLVGSGGRNLHSHVTGVLDAATNSGVGRALKQHQWSWAKENGFSAISWTFDPLVRRNAHFNLVTLGATAVSYHQNFYGELDDLINAGEQTDRLVVERRVAGLVAAPYGEICIPDTEDELITTHDDIVGLRKSHPDIARAARQSQREEFEKAFAGSRFVRGLTSDGSYVLTSQGAVNNDN